jgi:ABC-type nitrate/sulfonate/bicarbonate transport system substrate-binding protein
MVAARNVDPGAAMSTVMSRYKLFLFAAMLSALASVQPANAETLRVGKSTLSSFSYTLLEVGMKAGIFAKHGLEIQSSAFGGGPRLTQAIAAGAIDIGLDGGTDMALIAKGAPMISLAPLSGAPLEMVIAVRYDGPVKTVADLKGKKIAVTGAGTLTGWITRELARAQGWTDRDITYVTSTSIASSRALLKTGEIDAVTTDLTTTLEAERLGRERLLYTYGDLVKDFHMQIIFATDKVMAEKPQAVREFMAAWFETIAFAKANKEKTVSIIQQVLGFHPDVLNDTYDRVINTYSSDGKFNPRALAVLARSYVELKLLDHEPDMTKLYTEEFLPKK